MKIEFDLLQAATEPDLARVAAVAVLSALPQDAAEMAIAEWRAVLEVRLADSKAELDLGSIKDTLHYEVRDKLDTLVTTTPPLTTTSTPIPTTSTSLPTPVHELSSLGEATRLEDTDGGLSAKTVGALKRAGFKTLGDLRLRKPEMLMANIDRFGKKAAEELDAVMRIAGLWPVEFPTQEPREVPVTRARMIPLAEAAPPVTAAPEAVQLSLPAEEATGTGIDAQMTLRELCRQKEAEVGRERVWLVMQKHGVLRLVDVVGTNTEPTIRADLEALA